MKLMKRYGKVAIALVLCLVLATTAWATASYRADLDDAEVCVTELSAGSKTVKLTAKVAEMLSMDGFTAQVKLPEGWKINAIANSTLAFTTNNFNLANGMIAWYSSDAENVKNDLLAEVTIGIPAGTEAGEYEIEFEIIDISRDFGIPWESGMTLSATLTVGEHTDGEDADHLCDNGCGKVADDGCHDAGKDGDHKCDECGEDDVTDCADNAADRDHKCDDCGETVSECVDADSDNYCDDCGAEIKSEEPTDPSEPEETEPTEPSEPEETDPTEPSEPEETEPTEPSEPEETDPTEPSEPEETEPTEPSEPEETDPTEPEGPVNPFVDVIEGKFYYEPVLWAVDNGITNGIDDTHFAPLDGCSRAHVVTFLWRAAGSPEPESVENPFTDVVEGKFYYKAVLWAVEEGITNGVSKTEFAPNQTCTRGQIVTFLWRYAGEPMPVGTGDVFTDLREGAFYMDAVAWAVENGITNGMGNGKFAPNETCTRGQVVTFLQRTVG